MLRRLIALVLLLALPSLVQAQPILFDVKSPLEVKHSVRAIKHGVMMGLRASSWAGVAEFGEAYSLWITGVQRKAVGDSVLVRMTYEVRTPAALTRGQPVATGYNVLSYAWADAQAFEAPELRASVLEANPAVSQLLQRASLSLLPEMHFFGSAFVGGIARAYVSDFNRSPEPWELYEGTVLGGMVLLDLTQYFERVDD